MIEIPTGAVAALVERVSSRALEQFRTGTVAVANKRTHRFDPVTEVDRRLEAELRQGLAELVGELPVIGEEHGITGNPAEGLAWVIDPIDGTRAFISGQPQWGTLLGLLHDGRPVGGWMHVPVLAETYWAHGADAGVASPTTIRFGTSGRTSLAEATVTSTHPEMFEPDLVDAYHRLVDAARLTRFGGDCHNYGLLATGDVDAVVESQLQPYDILPLIPIITAAGGVVTDGRGGSPLDGGTIVAAATAELHREILALL